MLEPPVSEVLRCIVGRSGSSDEPEPFAAGVAVAGVSVSEVVESSDPVRRCNFGRSGSSDVDAAGVVAGVAAGLVAVESPPVEVVESELSESVRRRIVGRELSCEVLVGVEAEVVSALSESGRRRIVGRDESSAAVEFAPSVLLPSFGRGPPLATI